MKNTALLTLVLLLAGCSSSSSGFTKTCSFTDAGVVMEQTVIGESEDSVCKELIVDLQMEDENLSSLIESQGAEEMEKLMLGAMNESFFGLATEENFSLEIIDNNHVSMKVSLTGNEISDYLSQFDYSIKGKELTCSEVVESCEESGLACE